jgi:hypothetical protein
MKRKSNYIRFNELMNTPLSQISDRDLEWCSKQDGLNSATSKYIWLMEIERRKKKEN